MRRRAEVRSHASEPRSDCPVACSLDLVGDRWTLLIVRDLLMGKRRFSEFLASGEGITTNILTERLKRLERAGLVERSRYAERPPRHEYRLTDRGAELSSVVKAIAEWGRAHLPGLAGSATGRTARPRGHSSSGPSVPPSQPRRRK